MTQFNKGWWNCFVSFANELLLYRKDVANNDVHIISVLRAAGVSKNEILTYLASNACPNDTVRGWLENYVDGTL